MRSAAKWFFSTFWCAMVSQPTCLPTAVQKKALTMMVRRKGNHQLALRRMSVKVFEGATKVSTTRATSESGWASVAATVSGMNGLLIGANLKLSGSVTRATPAQALFGAKIFTQNVTPDSAQQKHDRAL